MSTNAELSAIFDRMAKVLEITDANRFKINAHQRGARALKDLTADVAELAAQGPATLTKLDGIGKGLAEKIIEYVDTGKVAEHDKLLASIPPGLIDLLEIPGLGPKTVALFWNQANITTTEQLTQAITDNTLTDLPGVGKKKLDNIAKAIAFTQSASDRIRIGRALHIATHFLERLNHLPGIQRIDYAGSLRRGQETIGDIDILVAAKDPEQISQAFRSDPTVTEILVAGPTKSSVRTTEGVQVDLRLVPLEQYGAALLYFTGSKEHNVLLRQRAINQDLRLNEYGLYHAADADSRDTATPLASKTEKEIYAALDLPLIPPELREDRGELALAEQDQLPKLLSLSDIRAELHAHTTASDGKLSIAQLAAAAKERNFHTIAVTDHSTSQHQAHGLDPKRLEQHIAAVREADAQINDIRILAGSEVDILSDGSLDYPDSLLKELDIVVASPHAALSQPHAKATARLRKAIEHPLVHIIGHPTGRLIGKREGLAPNLPELFKAAAEHHTALEINASPFRLDLKDTHARAAIELGCKLAINTDTHQSADLDNLRFGVLTARRAGATKQHVINTLTAKQLAAFLAKKR